MFKFEGRTIDLMITKGHNLYASLINKQSDRKVSNFNLYRADTSTSSRSNVGYLAQRPMRMLRSCKASSLKHLSRGEAALAKLIGFFIGDGSLPSDGSVSHIKFHLKKSRKIDYLKSLCSEIEGCTLVEHRGGHFSVKRDKIAKDFSRFLTEGKKKTFQLLYGNITPDENFPYLLKSIHKTRNKFWEDYKKYGYIETRYSGRKIVVSEPSINKVFNYYVQSLESEVTYGMLYKLIPMANAEGLKPILYTYDSILFDIHQNEISKLMDIINSVIDSKKYPFSISTGSNYNTLKEI
jgi:hypothetical protein